MEVCKHCRKKYALGNRSIYIDYCSRKCKFADKLDKKTPLYKTRAKIRFEVLKRDNFTCQYCGRKAPEVELELDHKIPIIKKGKDEKNNLITSCKECNLGKGISQNINGS